MLSNSGQIFRLSCRMVKGCKVSRSKLETMTWTSYLTQQAPAMTKANDPAMIKTLLITEKKYRERE